MALERRAIEVGRRDRLRARSFRPTPEGSGALDRSRDRALNRRRFGVRPMLVDGKWSETWRPVSATDAKGGFVRQVSSFRSWVTPNGAAGPTGEGGFRAESGRYHLYASFGCPWATRVLIARKLKRLE